jgi:hypothetical protein
VPPAICVSIASRWAATSVIRLAAAEAGIVKLAALIDRIVVFLSPVVTHEPNLVLQANGHH